SAYNYLPASVDGFYTRREFEKLLARVGFSKVRSFDYSGGIATAFIGHKLPELMSKNTHQVNGVQRANP
ncbi:MAG: class I SAM-dependent methyltransferase, partial [Abitibacteriaceae bacterium]|nr:class I SAM-dependent methyltransferase [Abditibacteriaceae bacterium]